MPILASPGIYRIRNTVNGKAYYGQTRDISARWKQHRSQLRCGTHGNSYLKRAWDKYGEGSFVYEAVLYCEIEDLDRYEIAVIAKCGEYNLSDGGRFFNCRNRSSSTETREKIAAWHRGRKKSQEAVRRSAESRKGIVPSAEHRLKISQANTGRTPSPGQVRSAVEGRARLLGWVEITYPDGRTEVVLNSTAAAAQLGMSGSNVRRYLREERPSPLGYYFRRVPAPPTTPPCTPSRR